MKDFFHPRLSMNQKKETLKERNTLSNRVIKVPAQMMKKMKDYYKDDIQEKTPPGGLFLARLEGCTITAYRSGKVMFQGRNCNTELLKWEKDAEVMTNKKRTAGNHLPPQISQLSIIGSDEVGTGDYFGPITVVASYVKKEQIPTLTTLGVKDSKHLSDTQIIQLAKTLITTLPYSLLTLPNKKYNELQNKGMTQGKMKALLHNQALNHLLAKISPEKPEAILVDQFVAADTYFKYLQGQKKICKENVYFSTNGESVHLAVAASSIIARYAFLKAMDQLGREAGIKLPKGAGHRVDKAAAILIAQKGEAALTHFTKLHFANTEKAKKIAFRSL